MPRRANRGRDENHRRHQIAHSIHAGDSSQRSPPSLESTPSPSYYAQILTDLSRSGNSQLRPPDISSEGVKRTSARDASGRSAQPYRRPLTSPALTANSGSPSISQPSSAVEHVDQWRRRSPTPFGLSPPPPSANWSPSHAPSAYPSTLRAAKPPPLRAPSPPPRYKPPLSMSDYPTRLKAIPFRSPPQASFCQTDPSSHNTARARGKLPERPYSISPAIYQHDGSPPSAIRPPKARSVGKDASLSLSLELPYTGPRHVKSALSSEQRLAWRTRRRVGKDASSSLSVGLPYTGLGYVKSALSTEQSQAYTPNLQNPSPLNKSTPIYQQDVSLPSATRPPKARSLGKDASSSLSLGLPYTGPRSALSTEQSLAWPTPNLQIGVGRDLSLALGNPDSQRIAALSSSDPSLQNETVRTARYEDFTIRPRFPIKRKRTSSHIPNPKFNRQIVPYASQTSSAKDIVVYQNSLEYPSPSFVGTGLELACRDADPQISSDFLSSDRNLQNSTPVGSHTRRAKLPIKRKEASSDSLNRTVKRRAVPHSSDSSNAMAIVVYQGHKDRRGRRRDVRVIGEKSMEGVREQNLLEGHLLLAIKPLTHSEYMRGRFTIPKQAVRYLSEKLDFALQNGSAYLVRDSQGHTYHVNYSEWERSANFNGVGMREFFSRNMINFDESLCLYLSEGAPTFLIDRERTD
ncbi:hypothetical protein KP509_26G059700 [Ceratopteris richardii]|uniref:Uncharacterized protein n=1 Tax=Ceratopteris richardii TaxID=49495 RepID=A0A8T2RME7_CERRI|nr:hypothetical protein KP509_26G059700 [Ceratopteris richardii]